MCGQSPTSAFHLQINSRAISVCSLRPCKLKPSLKVEAIEFIKTYREVASAIGGESVERRPILQEAISHAQRERLPILVARLDRVSRNADELERVAQASGIKIVSVREGPAVDPVTLRVESARISHETQMLRERTLNGLQRAKREGKLSEIAPTCQTPNAKVSHPSSGTQSF